MRSFQLSLSLALIIALPPHSLPAEEAYFTWKATNFAIQQPLGGLQGDAQRGRNIARKQNKGNCLACHSMPIPEEPFHGTIGPGLDKIAARMTVGQLRLHIVDQQQFNPMTVMPAFYINPKKLNRVLDDFYGKTILSGQEVEDLIAYLMTLK